MNTYKEMIDRHQAAVNALPLAFAFSEQQYKRKLDEWKITEEEARAGAVVGIGAGGFIRSTDAQLVADTFNKIQEETRAAIAADHTGDGFIYEMFLYELQNHEFIITQDTSDTLAALDITEEELNASQALQHGLKKAVNYINSAGDPFGV